MVRPGRVEELVLDVIFQIRMDVRKAPGGKLEVLKDIYDLLIIQQSIVFVEMRKDADRIARLMTQSSKLHALYVCIYVCIKYVCMYVYMYVHMYVCMYVCNYFLFCPCTQSMQHAARQLQLQVYHNYLLYVHMYVCMYGESVVQLSRQLIYAGASCQISLCPLCMGSCRPKIAIG